MDINIFMMSKDGDTIKYNTGYVLDGMYIPYEVTKHSQSNELF